jgi:methylated-DNA-protein-cysteine methyltransferase-like protein
MNSEFQLKQAKILSVIRAIPKGNVASYGQIATIAGIPRGHRLVTRALREANSDDDLPWYRVIRGDGRCGMPEDSKGYIMQFELLKSEGVIARKGKVEMKRFQWKPDMDFLLFRPQDL